MPNPFEDMFDSPDDPSRYDADGANYEAVICPLCNGEASELGRLGKRTHYRCNECGGQFSMREDGLTFVDGEE